MAVAVSGMALAGAAAFATGAACPASAAIVAGHGDGGSFVPTEDFVIEESDFFLNEEDEPHHPQRGG